MQTTADRKANKAVVNADDDSWVSKSVLDTISVGDKTPSDDCEDDPIDLETLYVIDRLCKAVEAAIADDSEDMRKF
jgi:hypothetical protein